MAASLKKLVRDPEKLQVYDEIIKTQLQEGIVEEVIPSMITDEKKQFFISHEMVVKEEAETTKNRIVYDTSARAGENSASLNECLEVRCRIVFVIYSIGIGPNQFSLQMI